MVKVLGIDPGSNHSGWALINSELQILKAGVFHTPKDFKGLEAATYQMTRLYEIIVGLAPDYVGIEMFYPRGPRVGGVGTMNLIGALWWMAITTRSPSSTPFAVTPSAWKRTIDVPMLFGQQLEDYKWTQHTMDALGIAAYTLGKAVK
jgi:Holliday junction resolvasome RuvABC endonuclease subunit